MYLFILSSISTFPFAFRIFNFLSYSNWSALIIIPLLDVILPLLVPINLFPFSKICISVTSKLNDSAEKALKTIELKNKTINIMNNLFFVNFI